MDDTSDVTEDVRISNFVIPLRDDDLIEISDAGFYNVSVRPSYNVVEAKIQCFGNKLTFGHEWDLIFRYFDYCFATIKPSFEEDPHDLRFCLLPILQEGLEALLQKIRLFLSKLLTSQPLTDETDQREYLLSALLMYVYLISRVSMELESESIRRQKDTACKDGRRGRKALFERGTDSFMDDWIRIRLKTLDILQRVVGMQCSDAEGRAVRTAIKYLWQPCIVCPSMKRILKEVAYKMLENPELGKVSSQTWLIKIFGYLRTICCSFDVYPKVASELVSMMKHLDYLAAPSLSHNPFVHAIEANNSDEVMDPLYLSMLTYLGKLAPSDFSKPDVSARPFALFITTLAEKKSRLLNKYVANITLFLGNEPAIMRSAVLIAFVEVVCNIYSGNLPDGHARATRDRLLLYVQDHINDMNVNVRSRALQLWTRLAESERIPISFIKNGLIRDAGARLEDKSVTVRKNAAAFLKTLLEYNTLNSSLQVDGFLEELQKLLIKRKDLINKNPENGTAKSVMEKWSTVQGEVTDWIHECVEAYQNEKFTEDKTQDEEGIMKDASNPRKRLKALSEKELTQYVLGTRNIDDLDCSRFIFILDEHYPSESKEILHLTASLCRKLSAESNECRVGIQVLTGYLLSKQLSGVEMNGETVNVAHSLYRYVSDLLLPTLIAGEMNNDEALLDEEDRDRDYHMELSRIENDMKQCEAVITFALDIEKCMGTALKCVMVAQATELVELIDFLVNCSKFNIRHSENAVRELFRAVWRRDDKVREAIVNAGLRLFFSTNPDKEISIRKSAENLIKVALSVPEKHRVSLEEVLYLMIKANMFPVELLDVLSQSICSSQSALRIAAMRIFSIVNKAKKLFMRGKFSFFVELCRRDGFFDGDDGTLAREYFHAIAMLGDTPDMRDLATMGQRPFRIPYSHLVVRCIIGLMVNNFTVKVYRWIPMMESALNALFYITAEPSHCIRDIASQLLRQTKKALAINILSECELNVFDTASARCDQDTNENNTILNESLYEEFEELVIAEERWLNANCDVIDRNCSVSEENVDHFEEETDREALETHKSCKIRRAVSSILRKERNEKLAEFELCAERLCAFIGQVALKTLIHVDVSFVAEIKRKNELLHAIRHMKSQTFTPLLSEEELETFDENTASLLELDSMHRIGFFDFSEDEQDDRLGLTGISEDDRVVDQARQICEHFIFKKGRLLSRLARFVIFLAKTKNKVCSERVQTVAALALSKLMLLSSRVCSGYMPVFIELLSTSTSPECRSNLMIAAGDLCARFPNIVEQYSDALYGRILDNDNYVRMTCLIVLSHLILNDMVKLRSTVADIACCLLDTSVEIVRITRFFFSELALKDNSMYNLMADVISRLLAKDDISIEKFKEIMSYLLSFIKKEKQADSLIVKLAERLPLATGSSGAIDIRTAHCVSYCISRLPLTENSLRKLAAALPTFSHLLSDEVFFSHLMLSVNHFKRFSRNAESKAIQVEVDEFVETLNKLHREKINLEETADRIVMYKRKAGNKSPLKQHRQVRRNLFH